jgi:hypothetical protein
MPAISVLRVLLENIPSKLKRRIGVHLGTPDLFCSLKQLRKFGFVPKNIMDVGAFQGGWTKICLDVFPEAIVTCIEPLDPEKTSLRLKRNAVLYTITSREAGTV